MNNWSDFLLEHNLLAMAFINTKLNNISFIENNYNIQENPLFQVLFNKENSITDLNGFLDGKILPSSF